MKSTLNLLSLLLIFSVISWSCDGGGGVTEPEPEPVPADTSGSGGSTNTNTDENPGADVELQIRITEGMIDDNCYTGLTIQVVDKETGGSNYNTSPSIPWDTSTEPEGVVELNGFKEIGTFVLKLFNSEGTEIDSDEFVITQFKIEEQSDVLAAVLGTKALEPACP